MRRTLAALAFASAATVVPASGQEEQVVNGVITQSDPLGVHPGGG